MGAEGGLPGARMVILRCAGNAAAQEQGSGNSQFEISGASAREKTVLGRHKPAP